MILVDGSKDIRCQLLVLPSYSLGTTDCKFRSRTQASSSSWYLRWSACLWSWTSCLVSYHTFGNLGCRWAWERHLHFRSTVLSILPKNVLDLTVGTAKYCHKLRRWTTSAEMPITPTCYPKKLSDERHHSSRDAGTLLWPQLWICFNVTWRGDGWKPNLSAVTPQTAVALSHSWVTAFLPWCRFQVPNLKNILISPIF